MEELPILDNVRTKLHLLEQKKPVPLFVTQITHIIFPTIYIVSLLESQQRLEHSLEIWYHTTSDIVVSLDEHGFWPMQWTDNNPPLQHNAFWSYNFSHLPFWKHTENILARLFVPYMSFSDVLYFPHKTVFSRKNHVLTIVLSYVCLSLDFLVQSCIIAAWITRLNQTELKPPFYPA